MSKITWTLAEQVPDSDITVLLWTADGEWFAGWWDAERGEWLDAASGGVVEVVTHWGEPEGPDVRAMRAPPGETADE